MTPDLSPKGVGEILDAALALARRRWRPLFGAAMLTLFPFAFLVGTFQSFYLRDSLSLLARTLSSLEGPDPADIASMQPFAEVLNAANSAYLLFWAFFVAALYASMPALIYDAPMTARRLLTGRWRSFMWFVLAGVALYAAVGVPLVVITLFTLGFGLPIALGVALWLAARLAVMPTVAVAEEQNPVTAAKRSWALTSGHAWRTMTFAAALWVLAAAASAAISSPAVIRQVVDVLLNAPAEGPLAAIARPVAPGWKVMEGVLYALAAAVVTAVTHVAWYRYYLDLRARREGMDIVMRARRAEEPKT